MSRGFVVPSAASSWSLQEIQKLKALIEAGTSISDMALDLRRTESAIRNRAAFHGLPLRGLARAASAKR